ncbi:hypothetical protein HK101_011476 [Irineochytrium annulatum]|nr:hypothetical protein HK101_011476 [Irineochytrium annulatum]
MSITVVGALRLKVPSITKMDLLPIPISPLVAALDAAQATLERSQSSYAACASSRVSTSDLGRARKLLEDVRLAQQRVQQLTAAIDDVKDLGAQGWCLWSAEGIAHQIASIDVHLLLSHPPTPLLSLPPSTTPHHAFTNHLRLLAISSILSATDPVHHPPPAHRAQPLPIPPGLVYDPRRRAIARAQVVQAIVGVAHLLLHAHRDVPALVALTSALNDPRVQRLRATWDLVPRPCRDALARLSALVLNDRGDPLTAGEQIALTGELLEHHSTGAGGVVCVIPWLEPFQEGARQLRSRGRKNVVTGEVTLDDGGKAGMALLVGMLERCRGDTGSGSTPRRTQAGALYSGANPLGHADSGGVNVPAYERPLRQVFDDLANTRYTGDGRITHWILRDGDFITDENLWENSFNAEQVTGKEKEKGWDEGKRWGVWMGEEEEKAEAIRPLVADALMDDERLVDPEGAVKDLRPPTLSSPSGRSNIAAKSSVDPAEKESTDFPNLDAEDEPIEAEPSKSEESVKVDSPLRPVIVSPITSPFTSEPAEGELQMENILDAPSEDSELDAILTNGRGVLAAARAALGSNAKDSDSDSNWSSNDGHDAEKEPEADRTVISKTLIAAALRAGAAGSDLDRELANADDGLQKFEQDTSRIMQAHYDKAAAELEQREVERERADAAQEEEEYERRLRALEGLLPAVPRGLPVTEDEVTEESPKSAAVKRDLEDGAGTKDSVVPDIDATTEDVEPANGGGMQLKPSDVHVVAATNEDADGIVKDTEDEGDFVTPVEGAPTSVGGDADDADADDDDLDAFLGGGNDAAALSMDSAALAPVDAEEGDVEAGGGGEDLLSDLARRLQGLRSPSDKSM